MDSLDVAAALRRVRESAADVSPDMLSDLLGLAPVHFHQADPTGPVIVHAADNTSSAAYLLRGTIFWPGRPGQRRIVRGLPRFLPTSDYTTDRFAIAQEPLLAQAAHSGEVIAEPKLYGATIRVYMHNRELYCASDVAHDGGNPLVGAGIDNSRSLGIDYGGQAAGLLTKRYPRVERLARLGYVAVFVLQLPEFAPDQSVDASDMILVDVIDPDLQFVDRLEKERIAEDYGLQIVEMAARLTVTIPEPLPLLKRIRALEHQAAQSGSPGFVIKGRIDEYSDQMTCKVEPASERERTRDITSGDLSAVVDEIADQYDDTVWNDLAYVEGLMLDYLGTRHRSVRWRVRQYLADWQAARRLAGLK